MRIETALSMALTLALCAGGLLARDAPEVSLDLGAAAADGWASRRSELTVRVDGVDDERLAFLLDSTDLTDLFRRSDRGWVYRALDLPLPVGEHTLEVYRVDDDGTWTALANLPLRVRSERGFTERTGSLSADLDARGSWSDDDRVGSERQEDLEVDLQLAASARLARPGSALEAEIQMIGVSERGRALRAGFEAEPDRFDLASYRVRAEGGRASVELGHTTWGSSRYLVDSFSSRGLVGELRLGSHVELSAAVLNGTQIVGWDNPLGLDRSSHRAVAGGLGLEVLPDDPGALRIDVALLDASVEPLADFGQGTITDAEQSEGWSVQLQAGSPSRRLRFTGGWARSEFTQPADPLLAQDADLVAVEKEEREARFAELDLGLVQGAAVGGRDLNLALSASHSRVDPLFRSAGVWVQSDLEQNRLALDLTWSGSAFQAYHSRSEDNLDEIPSILTTRTRLSGAQLALPLAELAAEPTAALPLLSLGYQRIEQEGLDLPTDGGFSPDHLPDQLSEALIAGLEWAGADWQAGLRFESTEQDNRQPGRENDDFETTVWNVFASWSVGPVLDLGVELGHERFENLAFAETDVTDRIGVRTTWNPTERQSVSQVLSWTETDRRPQRGSDDRLVLDLEWTWRFLDVNRGARGASAQLYLRGSSDDTEVVDRVFGFDEQTRSWSFVSGFALSFH